MLVLGVPPTTVDVRRSATDCRTTVTPYVRPPPSHIRTPHKPLHASLASPDALSLSWLRPNTLDPTKAHPDDTNHGRWRRIVEACQKLAVMFNQPLSNIHIWLEYSCVDQSTKTRRAAGRNGLPFFLLMSSCLVSIGRGILTHLSI